MLWLDMVPATPLIGFAFEPWLHTFNDHVAACRKFFTEKQGRVAVLTLAAPQPLDMTVEAADGIQYMVGPDSVSVQFRYPQKLVNQPGGKLPIVEPTIPVKPYSELLEYVAKETEEFLPALLSGLTRQLIRIGIVASAYVDLESPPPGVEAFVKHLGAPWKAQMTFGSAKIGVPIEKQEAYTDRCIHNFEIVNDERLRPAVVALDWQRIYDPHLPLNAAGIVEHVAACKKEALAYFDKFGKGDFDYAVGC